MKNLDFHPFPGLKSPHLQTIVGRFLFQGSAPDSQEFKVHLDDGDCLSCQLSLQPSPSDNTKMIVMIHGLGGSHTSGYLIRLSRKFHQMGHSVLRVNLRNCGSGTGLAKKPYNAGTSQDVAQILAVLKERFPSLPVILIGFSLGGNLVLKLAGELGVKAEELMNQVIAVCPTLDLYCSVNLIEKPSNWIYHRYYLSHLLEQGQKWINDISIKSIYEFDDRITAPQWGYKSAIDYYAKSSAKVFIPFIHVPTKILFAEDDPFVETNVLETISIPSSVAVFTTKRGGHMGYIGFKPFFWMDDLLKKWIREG